MPYVYPDTSQPVPPDVEAGIVRVPPGVSPQWPLGAYFTADGRLVTKLKDATDQPFGSPLEGQQDAGSLTKVDLSEVQAQLDRIEAKVDQVLAK